MEVQPLTDADTQAIGLWRYAGRYATYDVGEVVTAERGFWAVHDEDGLLGYCCFGHEARVPGVVEEPGILDVGYGMRPDLMGQGLGRGFISSILEFASREFSPRRFRLLILEWNARSRAAARSAGFEEAGTVQSTEGRFVLMIRHGQVGHASGQGRTEPKSSST
jgi:[ribosomal protein S18]-alanine N-acetyltransferase